MNNIRPRNLMYMVICALSLFGAVVAAAIVNYEAISAAYSPSVADPQHGFIVQYNNKDVTHYITACHSFWLHWATLAFFPLFIVFVFFLFLGFNDPSRTG